MAVIKYKDKFGNVRTVNSIKGDRGPVGPRGPVGATGPTGPKGGTLIKGSFPTLGDLKAVQHMLDIYVGDGYIIEDEEALYIWDGYKWVKGSNYIPMQLDHLTDVSIPETSLKHGDILVYDATIGQWVNTDMEMAPGHVSTTKNVTVTIKDGLGGYEEGELIPIGTRFEDFVEDLVSPPIHPDYKMPTLELKTDRGETLVNRGEAINPILYATYKANDAGAIRHCYLYVGDQKLDTFSSVQNVIMPGGINVDRDLTYRLEVYYEEGEVKVNNEGDPDKVGLITRGMISAEVTIKCGTPYWGLTPSDNNMVSAIDLLTTTPSGFNLDLGGTIEAIANESSKSIKFVYPKFLGPAKEICYLGFDSNSMDLFNRYEVSVFNQHYTDPVPYYVYQYDAPIEIGYAKFVLKL